MLVYFRRRNLWLFVMIFLIITLLTSIFHTQASATELSGVPLKDKINIHGTEIDYDLESDILRYSDLYTQYLYAGASPARDCSIPLQLHDARSDADISLSLGKAMTSDKEDSLIWDNGQEYFEWDFVVENQGLYEIEVEYLNLIGDSTIIQRQLNIDGAIPFFEAGNIMFYSNWVEEAPVSNGNNGDQIAPALKEMPKWKTISLADGTGMQIDPYQFYFRPGNHSLKLVMLSQPIAIKRISIIPSQVIPVYTEVKSTYINNGYKHSLQTVKFQAEDAGERNDPSLLRKTSNDLACEPYSFKVKKLNVIGDTAWQTGGQSITWRFDIPETGLYKISMRAAQYYDYGLPSYRQIAIDDTIPFKEMQAYCFDYSSSWYIETLHDQNGDPFEYYLEKGQHTLTMTVNMGSLSNVINEIDSNIFTISEICRDITKLTGQDPDPNFDYEFFNNIPGLIQKIQITKDSIENIIGILSNESNKKPAIVKSFSRIRDLLDKLVKDQFSIVSNLSELNTSITDLGSWSMELKKQPLMLDYFEITPPQAAVIEKHITFLEKLSAFVHTFIYSFVKDYNNVGTSGIIDESKEVINVWVGRSTAWNQVMDSLIERDFAPGKNIIVKLNMIPAGQLSSNSVSPLLLSIAAGKAPDVALGVDSTSPVEFSIRNAVTDLSEMPDYDKIISRFVKQIMVPFTYRGGTFALPENMGFEVMIYRKDVLSELGLKLPNTWDDVFDYIVPKLYQNGMQFYYNAGFNTFLFQHGGSLYRNDGAVTGLDTDAAYMAFKEWTELYTVYNFPVTSNFFNRFRSGEMPIGVINTYDYIQIATLAPELAGRWGVAPIPGTLHDDGTINRATTGIVGSAAIILSQSKHEEASWQFLDWWTSEDVQVDFARGVETSMGMTARWTSANLKAFSQLPWQNNDEDIIIQQLNTSIEVPNVLGGIYSTRHINNAFVNVVAEGKNPRDVLERAVKNINKELKQKQEEYNYTPGKAGDD